MPIVKVTLRPDYLARYVDLRIGKGVKPRVWEVQAGDANGFFTVDVTIDGEPAPKFKTRRAGMEWLGTMRVQGMETARIWAEPRDRRPSAYVTPSQGGGYAVQGATA